jgi:hypothetical protein
MMWLALGMFIPVVVVLGVAKAPGQVIVPSLLFLLALFLAGLVVVFVGFGVGPGVRATPPPGPVTPAVVETETRAAETLAAMRFGAAAHAAQLAVTAVAGIFFWPAALLIIVVATHRSAGWIAWLGAVVCSMVFIGGLAAAIWMQFAGHRGRTTG